MHKPSLLYLIIWKVLYLHYFFKQNDFWPKVCTYEKYGDTKHYPNAQDKTLSIF